ncbi:MAG TPA: class I SAM-dependent methyltransferase [Nocardioides sp.]|uniref:class I SAM-dependent methyltransferase n=1 Tax=Nocardioides sp. TaxID=35761 RepID=UPI002E33DA9B|nr:class I SAM-dependent methyltransferase [Nocardioides sp.]HEX3931164.1 class I SAM-dependent methyltransferase [Nocardioides sp.]
MALEPDTKDWTWVLDRPCDECGFEAGAFERPAIPRSLRSNAQVWLTLLADPSVGERIRPDRWSTLEYACHVHDVHQVYHDRVTLMLVEDDPEFADWDQDRAAAEGRYSEQLAGIVGPSLVTAAYAMADLYAAVPPLSWRRPGRRSNGSRFTIETLARYQLHDVVHHLHDVRHAARAATIRAYDADASGYREATAALPPPIAAAVGRYVGMLGPGARVLEVGSGSGRDALALEEAGLSVRRTDITPAFVRMLRDSGHAADQLDPLHDDLADPAAPGTAYDGVWADASLLHVDRDDLPAVLARLGAATKPGGALFVSVKEGDGEGWSVHGNVTAPRFFTFWRAEPLRSILEAAGWQVHDVMSGEGREGEPWLEVLARRA